MPYLLAIPVLVLRGEGGGHTQDSGARLMNAAGGVGAGVGAGRGTGGKEVRMRVKASLAGEHENSFEVQGSVAWKQCR